MNSLATGTRILFVSSRIPMVLHHLVSCDQHGRIPDPKPWKFIPFTLVALRINHDTSWFSLRGFLLHHVLFMNQHHRRDRDSWIGQGWNPWCWVYWHPVSSLDPKPWNFIPRYHDKSWYDINVIIFTFMNQHHSGDCQGLKAGCWGWYIVFLQIWQASRGMRDERPDSGLRSQNMSYFWFC